MENNKLLSFQDIVRDLSQKYSIPFEIVESILRDWVELLSQTTHSTNDSDLSNFEG